ncbi:MAG: PD-(D/E)XK nuclease-like domain-containing protein [[Lactobacillus] timonensis]|jgi:hypothetical protein|uniref:PD-(D/E)XK nuclease-like domain-containing protein n=1 Tax=[Lactobacillus] timonensis TaxID=1970790 RepID=UPI0023567F96|nr:PD-(D/E)XK nuclease-like domain-containing protein [[Lactobacillus] timonensis]MCI1925638.1 PD-(D/E)XK nuclease-like domain-containing protein [[Lactobacillus] timonensis]MCI1956999.1 PD-(D/E)XK nuclease-like domain-containing protein [[Lactobacillus] timonensis]MCI1970046.1 PD-(D/E)XK nuclease-like domain-containing protein [[Lactobacillus] timonensis]MCI2006189.1 PD-(D/E)XK nuclease-like domain-containing protein [[Lactobacillus] timonensis]
MSKKLKLTADNYYSHEADAEYMSVSMFKQFKRCEAQSLAEFKGEWELPEPKGTNPLILGNFVHSFFQGKKYHKCFINQDEVKKAIFKYGNPEKGIKKDYEGAEKMISVLNHDKAFQRLYMPGDKEVIVTGKIAGRDWKGKIDSLNLEKKYFCDLKTVKDIHAKFWDADEHAYVPFVKAYGYYYQIAMYRELIRQTFDVDCTPFIFAVSKQQPYPDHAGLSFDSVKDHDWLEEAMQDILTSQDHIFDVIDGKAKPKRCGKCDYCRATKQITSWINAAEIEVG